MTRTTPGSGSVTSSDPMRDFKGLFSQQEQQDGTPASFTPASFGSSSVRANFTEAMFGMSGTLDLEQLEQQQASRKSTVVSNVSSSLARGDPREFDPYTDAIFNPRDFVVGPRDDEHIHCSTSKNMPK